MATFRTDPDTGRTVISQDNIVSSGSTNPGRPGGESGERGDPVLSQQEFMNVTGRTATNPYGKQGFFSRVFGIDPSKISYTNNIPGGNQGIAQLNSLAYDRYMNPAARINIFGDEVGGDPTTGQLRTGVQPGDLTRFGRAVPARREGIAGILDNLPFGIGMASRMFGSTPARVPGFDVREVVPQLGLGGPQPGEGVDPARLGNSLADVGLGLDAVDYDTMAYYDSSYGVDRPVDRFVDPDAVDARAEQNRAISSSSLRVDDRLTPMRFAGDQSGLGDELEEFPQVPIPTELTFSKRTVVADPSRPMSLPPAPAQPLTAEQQFQADLASAYEESRRRVAAERQAQSDRLGFKMDMLAAQPKAFEPRAPLPPSLPPSLPPMFNEQVDLTNPAIFGLTGFRP